MIMGVKWNGIQIQRLENVTIVLDNRWLVTCCKLLMSNVTEERDKTHQLSGDCHVYEGHTFESAF